MKIFKALLGLVLIVAVGAFIYLTVADTHVEQTTITKNIPISSE